jgi:hypothetical protein
MSSALLTFKTPETDQQKLEMREYLTNVMIKNVCEVRFTKTDGTERTMRCTMNVPDDMIYEKKTERVKEINNNVLSVWDLEKQAYRSFRLDSIIDVSVLELN